jgi:cullin 3
MNVHVLTTGFWPTQAAAKCNLPPEVLNCCDVFKKFYLSNHNGRRLTWQTNMGTGELKAQFGPKRHELSVSTYQMCILLLFNNIDTLSYKEVLESTEIPISDLKRGLLSLTAGKYKVLLKGNDAKTIAESDSFTFNSKFRSKLYRVKIMAVAGPEKKEEAAETRQKIDEDRKHQ